MTLKKKIKKDNKKVDNKKRLSEVNKAALVPCVRRLADKFSPKVPRWPL
jgi:hypothetical protein